MGAKRVNALEILGNVFIEGDIVGVNYHTDSGDAYKEGRIDSITDDWLCLDQSEHYQKRVSRIPINKIFAVGRKAK